MEQHSTEWWQARLGKVTASKIADLTAKGRGGAESVGRANYRVQLVAERLTGKVEETFKNAAMDHGKETEPMARNAYEFLKDAKVLEVGFVVHPTIEMSGASPDGFVGDDGCIEIKCPNTKTQIDTVISGKVPTKYIKQIQWQLACTGRAWCDFVSYDPRLPDDKGSFFCKRVMRDPDFIIDLQREVISFLQETDDLIIQIGEAA